MQDGTAGAIFSLGKTEERSKFLFYHDTAINLMRIVFFKLKRNQTEDSNLQDLNVLNAGIVKANYYGKDFERRKGGRCKYYRQNYHNYLNK